MKIGINPDVLTEVDFERIGAIKKAADYVYEYVNWAGEDHSVTLIHKRHEKKIEQLVLDVVATFGENEATAMLAGYFIANVVKSAVAYEERGTTLKNWHVLTPSVIASMFDLGSAASALAQIDHHKACMYAGVFMSSLTSSHDKLAAILTGEVVGCDDLFIQTVNWRGLMEENDIDPDGASFVDVGRVLTQATYQEIDPSHFQAWLKQNTEGPVLDNPLSS